MTLYDKFASPEEQAAPMEKHLRAVVRKWARSEVYPIRRELDEDWKEHRLIEPLMDGLMGGLGLQKALFPSHLGGWSLGRSSALFRTTYALAEELGRADTGLAVAAMVTLWPLSAVLVEPNINGHLAEKLAPMFCGTDRAVYAALAMTEPQGGADIENMGLLGGKTLRTTATLDGDSWVINGHKLWPTNTGGVADLLAVPCTTNPGSTKKEDFALIFVPADTKGVTQGGPYEKAGMAADKNGDIWLEEVRVPASYRAHGPGIDMDAFVSVLPMGLVASVAFLTGAMLDVYERLMDFASATYLGGTLLTEHDATAAVLGRIAGDIDICRIVGAEAAEMCDRRTHPCGEPLTSEKVIARLRNIKDFVADRAVANLGQAVDILGACGPERDWDVEKHWRDIKMIQLWMGGKQLCQMEAARHFLGSKTI